MADLLELKEENPFRIRAYQYAVHAIESLPVELEQVMVESKLRKIPDVSEDISKKITELLTTEHLDLHEKLRAEFPEGIETILDIPGVGPGTAMRLFKKLSISTVDGLERAIIEGQVATSYRPGGQDGRAHPATYPEAAAQRSLA